jgi:hypothetical protein
MQIEEAVEEDHEPEISFLFDKGLKPFFLQ